eukprot:gene10518-19242_t
MLNPKVPFERGYSRNKKMYHLQSERQKRVSDWHKKAEFSNNPVPISSLRFETKLSSSTRATDKMDYKGNYHFREEERREDEKDDSGETAICNIANMKSFSLLLFLAIGILAVYGETVESDPIDDFDSDPEALDEEALEDSENDALEENAEGDPVILNRTTVKTVKHAESTRVTVSLFGAHLR